MEHKKTIFISFGTGKQAYLFQGNKGTVIPLGGRSHKRSNFQTTHQFVCLFIRLSTRHIKLCLWSTDSCERQNMRSNNLSFAYSLNIHCNLLPHTMINATFAVVYAAQTYEVSSLSWAYSSRTHYAINRTFHWFLWFCKAHISFFFMKSLKI